MLTCCGFLNITAALVFAFYFSIYTFLNQKVKKHKNIWRERNNISDQALIRGFKVFYNRRYLKN